MPDEEKKVKETGKAKQKEAEEQREPISKNEPTSKELTREQLEALRRKLQEKFH